MKVEIMYSQDIKVNITSENDVDNIIFLTEKMSYHLSVSILYKLAEKNGLRLKTSFDTFKKSVIVFYENNLNKDFNLVYNKENLQDVLQQNSLTINIENENVFFINKKEFDKHVQYLKQNYEKEINSFVKDSNNK